MIFNNRKKHQKPLSELEQLLMDYVWAHPNCTAEMCREGLAGQRALKDSTVRTVLRILEEKGYLTHSVQGRTFIYQPLETPRSVAAQAVAVLIDKFCGGSVEELLVGMVDNRVLEPEHLQRLAQKIKSHKERKQ